MNRYIKEIWKVFKHQKKEAFYLFYLENEKLCHKRISKNETRNSGEIDVNQLVSFAAELKGKDVFAIHNHPNGKPSPSFPDFFQKKYMYALLSLLEINMIEYGIVSPYGYTSFKDNGFLDEKEMYLAPSTFSYKEINCPRTLLSKDIEKEKEKWISLLSSHEEILFNNQKQFGSTYFSGEFLLENRNYFLSKCIFFCKKHPNLSMERLRDIDEVLEPFEIYLLDEGAFIPLKKNGLL